MDSEQFLLSDNEQKIDNSDNIDISLLTNESKNDSENDSDQSNNESDDLDNLDESNESDDLNDLNDLNDSDNSDESDDLDDSKSELLNYQNNEHQIDQTEIENTFKKVPNEKRITKPVLSKYEFNRIYGLRLKHITSGSKLLISVSDKLTIEEQVQQEIYEKKTPFIIRRNLPNNYYEDWKLNELSIPQVLFI